MLWRSLAVCCTRDYSYYVPGIGNYSVRAVIIYDIHYALGV